MKKGNSMSLCFRRGPEIRPQWIVVGFAILMGALCVCRKQIPTDEQPAYLNTEIPFEERAEAIISEMTLEEKCSQMRYDAPAIERLNIPEYNWWNECLHGVARAGRATVFPQAIGLAATWDTDLIFRIASAISDEARAKHHDFVRRGKRGIYEGLTFWSPNINIFRDPRWGRGQETYGEDPFLTGKMGVAFVRGLQGNHTKYLKTVATLKHFAVHSGPEPDRHTFDARIDSRDLRETYLPHFRMGIMEGGAYSVMCAYNRYMGEPCCGSKTLLTEILRNEWRFSGYVVSDCWAISDFHEYHKVVDTPEQAGALAVESGTDLNCGIVFRELRKAVGLGLLSESKVDEAVKRLFTARLKLGMFDPPERVPFTRIPYSVIDCDAHRQLAHEAACESIVLLKNEDGLLPLSKEIRSLAVIGPSIDNVEVLLGNYNGFPSEPITPLQGILSKVSETTRVFHAQGCDWAAGVPVLETIPPSVFFHHTEQATRNGLLAEYFNNRELDGEPVFTRIEPNVDANWWDQAPSPDLPDDDFSVRWTGFFVPPVTGTYALGGNGFNGFRIYLDGKEILSFNGNHHPRTVHTNLRLEGGRPYNIRLEFIERRGDARMSLLWTRPDRDLEKKALQIAERADAVIAVMGLSPLLEGEEMRVEVEGFEGGDRTHLRLPFVQRRLLRRIQALGKPVILVLMSGSAVAVNWEDENISAILQVWYPGQSAGSAIADILFGDANPAGRLPVTFYRSVDQLPSFDDYRMQNRTYRYFRGDVLYPFGYGLSYTSFEYSKLEIPETIRPGESVRVAVNVMNTGDRHGEEVVQVYLSHQQANGVVPIRTLIGFQRIHLKSGQRKKVIFDLDPRLFSLIDDSMQRVIPAGRCEIAVGGIQPGWERRFNEVTTEVLTGKLRILGENLPVE